MSADGETLRDLLIYLDEIGYGELYAPRVTGAAAAGAAGSSEAGRPAGASSGSDQRPARSGRSEAPGRTSPSRPAARPAPPPRASASAAPGALFEAISGVVAGTSGASETAAGPPAAESPPLAPAEERAAELAGLASAAATCERCRLCRTRTNVVFGSGAPDADLMLIGEGPGADEDRKGLPFVGRAGELLTRMIRAIDLSREEVYIANVVKCRPPGNRDPQADEVASCRPYLERQIDLIAPKVIVALGRVAAQTVLGNNMALGRMRGRWHSVRGVPTMVTYHPAALLRNPAWKRPTWEDLQEVRDRLREPGA